MMLHAMETVLDTFVYRGIPVEWVQWAPTQWCGFSSYAADSVSEPEVEDAMERYLYVPAEKKSEAD